MDEILVMHVVDLLGLDDLALLQQLQCHVFAILLVLGDLHLAETTCIKRGCYLCRGSYQSRSRQA